jgi:hypothetical protein
LVFMELGLCVSFPASTVCPLPEWVTLSHSEMAQATTDYSVTTRV